MKLSICISEKSIADAQTLAKSLQKQTNNVALLTPQDTEEKAELSWNKSSILSCENIAIEMENKFFGFDRLVVFCDPASIVKLQPEADRLGFVQMVDNQIKATLLLTSSVAHYFKRHKKGRIVFVLKSGDEQELKEESVILSKIAESAFVSTAEAYASLILANQRWNALEIGLLKYSEMTEEVLTWISTSITSEQHKNIGARWQKHKRLKLF